MASKINIKKIIAFLSLFYIIFPIILFLINWINPIISIPGTAAMIYLWIKSIDSITNSVCDFDKNKWLFFIISFIVIALWLYFSGIGAYTWQTGDFEVRNAIYNDLVNYKWPVIYDMEQEPEYVRRLLNGEKTGLLVYYFAFWLVPAGLTKIFGAAYQNFFFYMWSLLGLWLTFVLLVSFIKRKEYLVLIIFILFGGLDLIPSLLFGAEDGYFNFASHIEWWDFELLQYSSNTTLLYWVFNQAIPVWLITLLFMCQNDGKRAPAIASLTFAYSPFSTIGIIPMAIASVFNGNGKLIEKIKKALTLENITTVITMLVALAPFYKLVLSSATLLTEESNSGLCLILFPAAAFTIAYLLFVLFEFLVPEYLIFKNRKNIKYYWVTFITLLLIPMYRMGNFNDFCMRTSIPALFILMIHCIITLYDYKDKKMKRWIALLLVIVLGFTPSLVEINRNVRKTMETPKEGYSRDMIYSLGKMRTDYKDQIILNIGQYMALDFEDSLFGKYIIRKTH